jgi:GTPase SAR1 family protein
VIVVYDITNEKSFEHVENWLNEIDIHAAENVSIILVGNKSDLEEHRAVSRSRGEELAISHGIPFIETSAKTADNVAAAFDVMVERVFESQSYISPSSHAPGEVVKHGVRIENQESDKRRRCC